MAEALEAIMLICFGLSWPMNAYKNFKARTAAGTSWQFILLITLGYFAGIAAKFVSGTINWVLAVYFINVVCIAANWVVYFATPRHRRRTRPPAWRAGRSRRPGRSSRIARRAFCGSLSTAMHLRAGIIALRIPSECACISLPAARALAPARVHLLRKLARRNSLF